MGLVSNIAIMMLDPSLNTFCRKFLAKGSVYSLLQWMTLLFLSIIGYKVGRVEQAETALGAEMRMAADKGKGKASAAEKIVRR